MFALGNLETMQVVYGFAFLVMFLGLAIIKTFIHEVAYEFGVKVFRKRYLITYSIYFVIFMGINLILNPEFNRIFYYLLFIAFCIVDLVYYYIKDYRHLHELKKFGFFALGSLFAFVAVIEISITIVSFILVLTLGY